MFTPEDVNMERVQREIAALSDLGRQPTGGVTRYTFSAAHLAATQRVAEWMAQAGLNVEFDRWGNLFGRVRDFDAQSIVLTGSHLDSVPNGGNYDGPLGVLSSLEAVRLILEHNVAIRTPLEVVSFIEEEGARFRGLLGSSLATGQLSDEDEIDALQDKDGRRFLDVLQPIEFPYPVNPERDLRTDVASFIELHIEQGKRLEQASIPVGVVTSIAGPTFLRVELSGRADHAGATAYDDRRDTLLAAAEIICSIREIGETRFRDRGHMTVGSINVQPNVTNVIAGNTVFDIDYRAGDADAMEAMQAAIETLLDEVASKHNVIHHLATLQRVAPEPCALHIRSAVARGAESAGVGHQELVSWAAHDAMIMSHVTNMGMIFVACRDGRSHTPEEYVEPDDIAAGIAVLANTLIELAQ